MVILSKSSETGMMVDCGRYTVDSQRLEPSLNRNKIDLPCISVIYMSCTFATLSIWRYSMNSVAVFWECSLGNLQSLQYFLLFPITFRRWFMLLIWNVLFHFQSINVSMTYEVYSYETQSIFHPLVIHRWMRITYNWSWYCTAVDLFSLPDSERYARRKFNSSEDRTWML